MKQSEQTPRTHIDVIRSISKAALSAIVAAETSRLVLAEAESLGVTEDVLRGLETAGLLVFVPSQGKVAYWVATPMGKVCAELVCPKCFTLMSPGKALVGPPPGITYEGDWPVKFRDCLKCHSCGHSEYQAH